MEITERQPLRSAAGERVPAILPIYLTSLALIVFNAWLLAEVEIGRQVALGSMWSLFPLVLGEMMLLRLMAPVLSRLLSRPVTTQELIAVYLLVNLGTALDSFDGSHALTGLLAFPFSRSARFPGWSDRWLAYLPTDLMVSDPDSARLFVQGGGSFWSAGIWSRWLTPALFWSLGHGCLALLYLGVACLLFRHWTVHQRLSFPLTVVPLTLLSIPPSPTINRPFLTGAILALSLASYNRWQFRYPFLPLLPITIRQVPNPLVGRPWSALGDIFFGAPLWMIGVSFLVPLDVLFSSWFFYWTWRLLPVLAAFFGLQDLSSLYLLEASFGAYAGLGLSALWLSRLAFRQIGSSPLDRPGIAFLVTGAVASLVWSRTVGLSLTFLLAFYAYLLVTAVSVSRIRAELGTAVYGMMGMSPPLILSRTIGMAPFSLRDLAVGVGILTYGFSYAQRSNLMPLQLEGMRLADQAGALSFPLVLSLFIAPIIGSFVSILSAASVFTRKGALSGKISIGYHNVFVWAYRLLAYWETEFPTFRWHPTLFAVGGTAIALFLQWIRLHLSFLPIHPLGFAIAGDYNCHFFWNALAIAWAVKGLAIRYGGISVYRSFLPFFLGIAIGDFVALVINGLILCITPYRVGELTL